MVRFVCQGNKDMSATLKTRTPWRQKLITAPDPKVVKIPPKMMKRFGAGTMLIPCPRHVDALIRRVPKGKLVTQDAIRDRLAREFHADVTCPITTGIFVRIAAEAAEESARDGRRRITPYWRVVRNNGALHEKLPGGAGAQARRLRAEGAAIEPGRGTQPPRVRDFEKRLVRL